MALRVDQAVAAVQRVLTNLEGSDFAANAGMLAMGELRKYSVDMAVDLYESANGIVRGPTDPEMPTHVRAIVEMFPADPAELGQWRG